MRHFAALLALLMSGCALPDYPCEVHLRPEGFNPAQLNAINDAVQGWTNVLGLDVVTLDEYGDTPIVYAPGGGKGAGRAALYPDGSQRIEIYKDGDYLALRYIAMHEIGHALGLEHSSAGVMQSPPPENRRVLPTPADAAQIADRCGY